VRLRPWSALLADIQFCRRDERPVGSA